MNIYLSVIFWWAAFPIAAVTFGVAIHGIYKTCVRCWRDHQFAKEVEILLGDKPGADRLLPPSLGQATTTSVSPSDPPFDWAS